MPKRLTVSSYHKPPHGTARRSEETPRSILPFDPRTAQRELFWRKEFRQTESISISWRVFEKAEDRRAHLFIRNRIVGFYIGGEFIDFGDQIGSIPRTVC